MIQFFAMGCNPTVDYGSHPTPKMDSAKWKVNRFNLVRLISFRVFIFVTHKLFQFTVSPSNKFMSLNAAKMGNANLLAQSK